MNGGETVNRSRQSIQVGYHNIKLKKAYLKWYQKNATAMVFPKQDNCDLLALQ